MQFCTVCGRPKAGGSSSCRGCGNPFVTPKAFGSPGPEEGTVRPGAPRPPSRWLKRTSIAAAGGLALGIAVAGLTLWPHGDHPAASGAGAEAGTSSPAAAGSGPATLAAPAADTPAPDPGRPSGPVAMTAAAAGDADAPAILSFLDSYFTAINTHDYQAYDALLSPQLQQEITQPAFDSGYQGTSDSAETLAGVSAASSGDTAAAVTFTSHQDPDAADNDESCTDWQITLYLQPGDSGYLIDPPPQGYHAVSAPCS
jgi:hypothetical protein